MKDFEPIDISGDAGIMARGRDLAGLFVNAALGMYSLITDPDGVAEQEERLVTARSGSLDGLLVAWLNELVFLFDAHGFVGRKVKITRMAAPSGSGEGAEEYSMRATVTGEEFDSSRHEGHLLIKAATYHRLRVERRGECWEAEVVFDI